MPNAWGTVWLGLADGRGKLRGGIPFFSCIPATTHKKRWVKRSVSVSLTNSAEASTLQLSFYILGYSETPPAFLFCSSSIKLTSSVVNNQLSGAWRVSLYSIDYLFKTSSYPPMFNFALSGKRIKLRIRLGLIVDDSASDLQ